MVVWSWKIQQVQYKTSLRKRMMYLVLLGKMETPKYRRKSPETGK